MTPYNGSCHCGAVKFRVDAVITEATTCDCSLCVKRNAVMVKGVNVYCLDDFDVRTVPIRATEGANMTVAGGGDRSEWPGPRV